MTEFSAGDRVAYVFDGKPAANPFYHGTVAAVQNGRVKVTWDRLPFSDVRFRGTKGATEGERPEYLAIVRQEDPVEVEQ